MSADLGIVDQVLADVAFIGEHWGALLELREPGTPRPWRQALLDPDRRLEQLARDLEERAVRDPDAPGFTSAPQHLEVLDVIVDVWTALDELVGLVRRQVAATSLPGIQLRRVTEIEDMCRFLRLWLGTAALSPRMDHGRLGRLGRRLAVLKVETSRTLGLVLAGQLLAGAVCPFCAGTTPKQPAGGAITMRVEQIAPNKSATDLRPAVEAVHAVVCWNPLCEPDSEHCGTRYRGRPAWPWHEWEWLAPQLIVAEPVRSVPPPSVPADFTLVPIDHSGRAGVDRRLPASVSTPMSLSGLLEVGNAVERGTRLAFRGGPFDRSTRAFVTHAAVLLVVQPEGLRPQLAGAELGALSRIARAVGHPELAGPQPRTLGAYRLVAPVVMGGQPHYEWRPDRTGLSA